MKPSLPPESVRAYRAVGVFVGAALVAFVVLFRQNAASDSQALVGLWLVAASAGALVAATFSGPAIHRYLRTGTYLLFLLTIGVLNVLAYQSAYDVPYAVGLMFLITALGLGGGVSARSMGWMGISITTAVVIPVIGLLTMRDPGVDPFLYSVALSANGASVYWIVWTRVETRASLEDERERYQSLFDRAAEGIYLADATTLRVLDANPAYLTLSGRTLDEIRQLRLPDLVERNPGTPSVEEIAQELARPGSIYSGSHRHRTASGALVDVDVSVSTLVYDGRSAFSVIVRNATAQRETERRLEDARERAEQLNSLKSALLSTMRHEVRTPLTGIMGYAELLRYTLEGEPLDYAQAITESSQRLHDTLEAVLDLAEAESGTLTVNEEVVDLAALVRSISADVARQAEAKGLTVVPPSAASPVRAVVDTRAFERAMRHVAANAVKFTEAGEIRFGLTETRDTVRVSVSDTGIGIPEEFRANLFESFQQASTGVTRTHQGAGLGLAIARRVTELMGGTIEVESEVGVGSTFTIVVPAAPADVASHTSRAHAWPDAAPASGEEASEAKPMTA